MRWLQADRAESRHCFPQLTSTLDVEMRLQGSSFQIQDLSISGTKQLRDKALNGSMENFAKVSESFAARAAMTY